MLSNSFTIRCTLGLTLATACSGTGDGKSGEGTAAQGASTTSGPTATSGGAGGAGAAGPVTTGQTSAGGTGGPLGDDRLFVPEDLTVYKVEGGGNYITLVALTLLETLAGTELYAAVRNDGDDSACDGNVTFEFFDGSDQSLLAWVGALYSGHVYQLADDPSSLIACLDPGEMAMAGTTELPESIDVDGLGYVVHRFSYFSSNVLPELIPVDGLTVSGVEAYSTASGSAFRGTLENGLELTLENPNVTIFPTNRVGRPLGMATGSAMIQLGPGETWSFETTQLNDTGVDHLVYPRASVLAQ